MPLTRIGPGDSVQLGTQLVQLLSECRIALHRIATYLLICSRSPPRPISDVGLQRWLAVSHRFSEEPGRDPIDRLGLVSLTGVRRATAQLRLQIANASSELCRIGDELPHSQVVVELFLQIRNRYAIGRN